MTWTRPWESSYKIASNFAGGFSNYSRVHFQEQKQCALLPSIEIFTHQQLSTLSRTVLRHTFQCKDIGCHLLGTNWSFAPKSEETELWINSQHGQLPIYALFSQFTDDRKYWQLTLGYCFFVSHMVLGSNPTAIPARSHLPFWIPAQSSSLLFGLINSVCETKREIYLHTVLEQPMPPIVRSPPSYARRLY